MAIFKPKSIYLTEFSLFKRQNSDDPPHFYDDTLITNYNELTDTRSHSLADSLLISSLSVRGTRIETDDRDLKPLVSNWGSR